VAEGRRVTEPEIDAGSGQEETGPGPAFQPLAPDRGRPRWLTSLAVAVLLIALGGAGLWAGRLDSGRRAREQLAGAMTSMAGLEPFVLGVDDVVQAPPSPDLSAKARDLGTELPSVRRRVREVLVTLGTARPALAGRDAQTADALRDAARARAVMLEEAAVILPAYDLAAAPIGPTKEAWALINEAAALSDRAAALYNEHTREGVAGSTRLTKEAAARLADAADKLDVARKAWAEPDLSPLARYVRRRQALATRSLLIDETWLSGKTAEANALLDASAKEQAALNAEAVKLPKNGTEPIAKAYRREAGASIARYEEARGLAEGADKRLRDLGSSP
jgi:hypothetical protein